MPRRKPDNLFAHADTFRLRQALFDGGWFEIVPGLEQR